MEGNKNIRPSTPSPSIKRTPTVKRGPVPPRVSRSESSSSKPQAKPSSVVTSGSPKVSASSRGRGVAPAGARSRKVAPASGGSSGKSKKVGLFIVLGVVVALIIGVIFVPFNDGKTLLSSLSAGKPATSDDDGAITIVDEEAVVDDDEDVLSVDGEESIELDPDDEDVLAVDTDDNTIIDEPTPTVTTKTVITPPPTTRSVEPLGVDEGMITSRTGKHYVILGSFSVKDNAYRLKNKLGAGAKIIAPYSGSNLYKVSVAEYSNLDAANKELEANMEKYGVDIWILSF